MSVLTEQDHFSGALADLVAVKRAHPGLAVLRKDFLLDREDVRIAWCAGADAVLLIAAILEPEEMAAMIAEAAELGLAALVETHDREDLERIRALRPAVVGINSRDLRTFRVDLLDPLALAASIDWECRLVFESGIFHPEELKMARDAGFSAVLVGESVVREPERVSRLAAVAAGGTALGAAKPGSAAPGATPSVTAGSDAPPSFWATLAARRRGARPLVKICGITSLEDARLAVDLGADLLGLVYAPSSRRAPEDLARQLAEAGLGVPLVAVVVEPGDDGHVERAIRDRDAGWIDALQLHGSATPEEAWDYGSPYYQAARPAEPEGAAARVAENRAPRMLIDARHPTLAGGTGRTVDPAVLSAVTAAIASRPHGALWLAGGLGADNIAAVVAEHRPELVDASSRLEASPGRKDPALMRAYFAEIDRAVGRATAPLSDALATANPSREDAATDKEHS